MTNGLDDYDSADCLKNLAVISTIIRNLPTTDREKWYDQLHKIDGTAVSDDSKPQKVI